MAVPVQLEVENLDRGFIKFKFTHGNETLGSCVIQYPQQGQLVRHEGDPSGFDVMVGEFNAALEGFNKMLRDYCS